MMMSMTMIMTKTMIMKIEVVTIIKTMIINNSKVIKNNSSNTDDEGDGDAGSGGGGDDDDDDDENIHSSFIHSGHFYSAPSSPLPLRGAPDYSTNTVSEFHAEAHRQLQVKDLPKVPT